MHEVGDLSGMLAAERKHTLVSRVGIESSICVGLPGTLLCKRFVKIGELGMEVGGEVVGVSDDFAKIIGIST